MGIVFFAHGAQKVFGWFGGYGFNGTMGFFTQQLGIPAPFAFLAIMAEFLGGLGLIVGFLGTDRGIRNHVQHVGRRVHDSSPCGLFHELGWQSKGGRIRVPSAGALVIGLVILIKGSGAFSVDEFLTTGGPRT